jgi:hypothetical protein
MTVQQIYERRYIGLNKVSWWLYILEEMVNFLHRYSPEEVLEI